MGETKQPPGADDAAPDIEREIRRGRQFSLNEALGRLGGEGMLKGASPVPPIEQTEAAIANYLRAHLADPGPHFEREGRPSDPDDPYTLASVRAALMQLLHGATRGDH